MKKLSQLTLVLSVFFISCDRPECYNANPIFDNYSPESETYKNELALILEEVDQSKLTYWLQKYEERDGKEFLYFHVQGEDLCAVLTVNMNHWDRLENLREQKGVTYRGAEFANLEFDIENDGSSTQFVYRTHKSIID